jgi:hypothetical protein
MRPLPPIPEGWRLLGPNEPLQSANDMWFNTNESARPMNWSNDGGVEPQHIGVSSNFFGTQFRWITKVASADKEWLNPWD